MFFMTQQQQEQGTRERLLEAAAEVFAEHGYEAATVREICRRAGANVAAVNYHFGGKEMLYASMLKHFMAVCAARHPLDAGTGPDSTPEERLYAFVRNLLYRIMGDDEAHGKLVAQETIDPSPAFDDIVHEFMLPVRAAVEDVVKAFLGQDAPEASVRACAAGIVGQAMFYLQNRSILERLYHDLTYDNEGLDRMAESITRFSLGGIAAWRFGGGEA